MIREIRIAENECIDDKIYELLSEMDIETLKEYFDFDKYIADCIRYSEIEKVNNEYVIEF